MSKDFTPEENEIFETKLTPEIQKKIEKEIIIRESALLQLKQEISDSEKAIAATLGLKVARFKKRLNMIKSEIANGGILKGVDDDKTFVQAYINIKNGIAPEPIEPKGKSEQE